MGGKIQPVTKHSWKPNTYMFYIYLSWSHIWKTRHVKLICTMLWLLCHLPIDYFYLTDATLFSSGIRGQCLIIPPTLKVWELCWLNLWILWFRQTYFLDPLLQILFRIPHLQHQTWSWFLLWLHQQQAQKNLFIKIIRSSFLSLRLHPHDSQVLASIHFLVIKLMLA